MRRIETLIDGTKIHPSHTNTEDGLLKGGEHERINALLCKLGNFRLQ